jgi:phage N-6-adenine-methyltransferase
VNGLVLYDAAQRALAAAVSIDEVKNIRDKAVALQVYAQQANDTRLIVDATGLRMRAEREWGTRYQEPDVKAKPGPAPGGGNGEFGGDPRPISPPTLAEMGVTKTQSVKWQALADLPAEKFEAKVEVAKKKAANSTTSAPEYAKAKFTGEDEWYTPGEYLDAARDVMGSIDLDPASSKSAQAKVQATRYFTVEIDGLKQEWTGRVWLNPPFAQPYIANFVSKMVVERRAGRVLAGIMLTHNYTDTAWFHEAVSEAAAICFTRGRVKFYDGAGEIASPTQGQAFFYFGDNVDRFAARFASIGFIVEPRR